MDRGDYKIFAYGATPTSDQEAIAREQAEILEGNIRYLVTREIRQHIAVPHDCRDMCFALDVAEALLDKMPADQVAFVAMASIQLLARAFLRDTPEALTLPMEDEIDGL